MSNLLLTKQILDRLVASQPNNPLGLYRVEYEGRILAIDSTPCRYPPIKEQVIYTVRIEGDTGVYTLTQKA
jgi:hypothetical protein